LFPTEGEHVDEHDNSVTTERRLESAIVSGLLQALAGNIPKQQQTHDPPTLRKDGREQGSGNKMSGKL
jgi:hypothetical protein